jgi:hypothetical protein
MNESFIFNSIRKYNRSSRVTQRDVILHAVGVHANLIEAKRSVMPTLTELERAIVLEFLRGFLKAQDLPKIEIKSF